MAGLTSHALTNKDPKLSAVEVIKCFSRISLAFWPPWLRRDFWTFWAIFPCQNPPQPQEPPRSLPGPPTGLSRGLQDPHRRAHFFGFRPSKTLQLPGPSQGPTSRGCQKVPAHVVGSHTLLKGLPSPFQGPLKIQGCILSPVKGLFKARFINFGSQETSLTSALSLHCPQ